MRKLLFIIAVLLSFGVHAQTFTPIHNYQAPDGVDVVKFFGIPHGETPTLNGVNRPNAHPLYYKTTDSSLYLYTGTQWIIVGGTCDTCISTVNISADSTLLYFIRVNGDTARIVDFYGAGGSGGITQSQLDDTAQAIRADFPTGSGGVSQSVISDTLNNYANSGSITTDNVIYSTPIALSVSNHLLSGSLSLKSQPAYTLFGRGSGSGSPSFLVSIDSNYFGGNWVNQVNSAVTASYIKRDGTTSLTSNWDAGNYSISINRLGISDSTFVDGINLFNNTPSTFGSPQYSPAIRFRGSSTGTSTTNSIEFGFKVRTFSGGTYGTGEGVFYSSGFDGNFEPLIFTSNGNVKLASGKVSFNNVSPQLMVTDSDAGIRLNTLNSVAGYSIYYGGSPAMSINSINYVGQIKSGSWNTVQMTFLDGQYPTIGIGTTTPLGTSIVDMTSTTKGVLFPRMTTIQKTAIASPANGLQLYDTDLKQPQYYDGVSWKAQVGMTFGTVAPSITPAAVGNFYLDTTNKKLYIATGTSSSSDWEILN